ncbi:MAG: ATP phosphoribosyltransferase [Actinomycetes bacterium]|jgi:ATP phosphoribosyltransferase regulatory subunit|nr:ATP phosphoribosyltransferase [Actinomycetes bacterium]
MQRPRGFRDILPAEARRREEIGASVAACFEASGYGLIETPTIDYYDAVSSGRTQAQMTHDAFRFVDVDGRLLSLRTDVTLPLARVVAQRFCDVEPPYRLRYRAEVFREQESLRGSERQLTQLGIECIGLSGELGDIELLRLALDGVAAAGIKDVTLHLSDLEVLEALADRAVEVGGLDANWKAHMRTAAIRGDFIRVRELVTDAKLPAALSTALVAILDLRGGADALTQARDLLAAVDVKLPDQVQRLQTSYQALVAAGFEHQVVIDFSVMPTFEYYTAMVFELYAPCAGPPLGVGGRYDRLLAEFGRDLPAAGFVYELHLLERALAHQQIQQQTRQQTLSAPPSSAPPSVSAAGQTHRKLRIAIPKGTLYPNAIAALRGCDIEVAGLDAPGRTLILVNDEVEIIIAKPSDVAIYVARGAADCGIGGRDILMEADFPLLQLVDLRFGACEFVVAAPNSETRTLHELSRDLGIVRVATKYPRLAQQYFDDAGISVEIVKLNGNIELAPLIGIADVIVDITQTGTTLRENDLRILQYVLPSTARFVANPTMARSDRRITKLTDDLKRWVEYAQKN